MKNRFRHVYRGNVSSLQKEEYHSIIKAIHSRKMVRFNITPEAIVGPIIMLGAGWVVKNIECTNFYT